MDPKQIRIEIDLERGVWDGLQTSLNRRGVTRRRTEVNTGKFCRLFRPVSAVGNIVSSDAIDSEIDSQTVV